MALPVLTERVERNILLIRGHRVMLDTDLAILYGVPTKRLNEQVRRNKKRFPSDFMFQLTPEEVERLRSQFATSKLDQGEGAIAPTHSPSKEWRCSQACCIASALSK